MPAVAIVLTGGKSSRMGADKASLVVDGVPMAERLVGVLAEVDITEVAIAGSRELPDDVPGYEGPMAGIVSGWRHLQRSGDIPDPVVVLSCDLPRLGSDVIRALLAQAQNHDHGVVAHDGQREQPLIAAYRPAALDAIDEAFAAGERSVRRCFEGWDLGRVHFPGSDLVDADTPEDLVNHEVSWPDNPQDSE